jgi:palmitoyltransferase
MRSALCYDTSCLHVCHTRRRSAIAFISVVINSAFAVSLAGFLVMHANMLAANCTTIEMYEKERIHPWPYNKGLRRNFEEVFGKR